MEPFEQDVQGTGQDGVETAVQGNTGFAKVANTLWPQTGHALLEEFLALMAQYYGVLITAVDYGKPKWRARRSTY